MRYAREHHFPNPTFFVDDGVSGVTYDRPGFQAMLAAFFGGLVIVGAIVYAVCWRIGVGIYRKREL